MTFVRTFLAAGCVLVAAAAQAQTAGAAGAASATPPKQSAAKPRPAVDKAPRAPAASTAAAGASRSATTTTAAAKSSDRAARQPASVGRSKLSRSAAKAVEEVTPVDASPDVVLSEADLAVAQRIYVGTIPCELGASVTIVPTKYAGFFDVQTKGARYRMHPVESRTGAIRLEDPKAGAMWLQLGNKSMLMNQKQGLRLADECTSPAQITVADEMKKNPVRGLLDADPPKTIQN